MNARQFRKIVCKWLATIAKDRGFVVDAPNDRAVRPIPDGRQKILLLLFTNLRYDFTFSHSIRLDRVEDLVNRYEQRDAEFVDQTTTACVRLFYFPLPPGLPLSPIFSSKHLNASNEAQLRDALDRLTPVYLERVFPFLDANKDAASVHNLFVNGIDRYLTLSGATRALAVAYFAHAPHFNDFVDKYRTQLVSEQADNNDLVKFDSLARDLMSGSIPR